MKLKELSERSLSNTPGEEFTDSRAVGQQFYHATIRGGLYIRCDFYGCMFDRGSTGEPAVLAGCYAKNCRFLDDCRMRDCTVTA